jgi:hypothetical protein
MAAALCLLALAACGRASVTDANKAAPPGDEPPVSNEMSAPTMAPSQGSGLVGAEPPPDEGGGPRNSFIVCPGNPRCPPEGSQPKGGQ